MSPTATGQLAISEIMDSPLTVADPGGEWFEIFNPGAANFDLNGCVISDTGADTHTIASLLVINRGEYGTLAAGATPGFVPGYVYPPAQFALNAAPDDIILTCGLIEIDRVAYDGTFPGALGVSMAVQDLALNFVGNDFAPGWCGAATLYNGDLGTPNAINDCVPVPPTLVSVTVTPNPSTVPDGSTLQFTATGNFSDASTSDLTATVTWSSNNPAAATISATGLATGVAPGAAVITALDVGSGFSDTSALTVTATLVSIAVTPAPSSVSFGSNIQFTATGTLSDLSTPDLTNTVTWSSSNPAIATVNTTGLATGVTVGTVTITAQDAATLILGTSTLTVSFVSEGSIPAPLDIGPDLINGTKTYDGQVGNPPSNSYYVTQVPAGTWDISMFNMVADADLELHSTNAFNAGSLIIGSFNTGTLPENITAITCPTGPGSCPLYFNVIGFDPGGTSFTLTVPASGGFINSEGTPEVPLNLGPAPLGPRVSSIERISDSHYQFVTNSLTGTFTISGLASDLDLFLFDTLANMQAGPLFAIASSETLNPTEFVGYTCAVGPCTFYITVSEFTNVRSNFTINITEP